MDVNELVWYIAPLRTAWAIAWQVQATSAIVVQPEFVPSELSRGLDQLTGPLQVGHVPLEIQTIQAQVS